LQDCDLHPCAEALFIHPNTLRYRLTRIEQITGLNFNKLDDKFLLYLRLSLDS
jgi:carbohydrate diacid regulator